MFCEHLENSKEKKLQSVILNSILTIVKKDKMKNIKDDCYNILTIGIYIIGLCVNIISELVFSIILDIFLLYILLEGKYYSFFTYDFFQKLSIQSLSIK